LEKGSRKNNKNGIEKQEVKKNEKATEAHSEGRTTL
jgi:hypothetical protein